MKRMLVALAVLGAMASPVWVQGASDEAVLRYSASGTAINLGNPLTGSFSVLATLQGSGPFGNFSARSLLAYQQIGPTGQLVCGGGQIGIRFESSGDTLLLNVNPGPVGTTWPVPPVAFRSEQSFAGAVVGGSGRFADATGSFSVSLRGFGAQPGFVQVAEGTIEITLDRK